MGIGPRMIRCGRLDGNWDNSRMIQYRWDRREERKMRGVRLSWSLGDRRGRPGTEKSGMLLMYLMWIITFDCICMQRVNLHLAFVVICDCKTLRLAAESLSRERVRAYEQVARVTDVQWAQHYVTLRMNLLVILGLRIGTLGKWA